MASVLVVEDRPENSYMLAFVLSKAGYEVHTKENGEAALAFLEKQAVNLIISDVLMPVMDGFQLCREIKRREALRDIPFVFYSSTYTEKGDQDLALSLGAAAYLVKPLESPALVEAVRQVLESAIQGKGGASGDLKESEESYLLEHNRRLIHKLQEKVSDLEKTTRDLESATRAKDLEMEERRRVEDALRASEARYRLIADHMGDVVWLWQMGSEYFTYVSPSVRRMTGFTPEEVMARPVRDSMVQASWEDMQDQLPRRIAELESGDEAARYGLMELDQPCRDGAFVPVEVVLRLLTDDSGKVVFVLGVSRDITERRKHMEAIQSRENLWRIAGRMAHLGGWRVDLRDKQVLWSDQVAAIHGLNSIETLDLDSCLQFYAPEWRDRMRMVFEACVRDGVPYDEQMEIIRSDGERVWVRTVGEAVRDGAGEIIAAHGAFQDITAQKDIEASITMLNSHLEQKVLERTAQFEASNRELEAFASSVSHDLKAPLRVIKGFSEALMEDHGHQLPHEGKDLLGRVLSEAGRMEALIDDLLRLSRVGQQEILLDEINVSELSHFIAGSFSLIEPERKVMWEVEPDIQVRGDRVLLRVLMENLLGNAWKFTAKKTESLIQVKRRRSEPGWTSFCICDNGAGFDPLHADRLFAPFQRLHSYDEFPGTGIGLAIVRRVANRHGAKVVAEGHVGEGTCILLSFPDAGHGPLDA